MQTLSMSDEMRGYHKWMKKKPLLVFQVIPSAIGDTMKVACIRKFLDTSSWNDKQFDSLAGLVETRPVDLMSFGA